MRHFLILLVHFIVTLARLAKPGGIRSVVAESLLVRHQLLVLNRGRRRAPNVRATDRIIAGLCTLSCARRVFSVPPSFRSLPLCCICTVCCVNASTACCFRPGTRGGLARRDR